MRINALAVSVFRFPLGDCTNNGISSWFDELLIACPDGPRSFFSEHEVPLNFCMIERTFGVAHLVPATVDENGCVVKRPGWYMHGGNIADTSDSRFRELSGVHYPLHIHDRSEW